MSVTFTQGVAKVQDRGFNHVSDTRVGEVLNWQLQKAYEAFAWPFLIDEKSTSGVGAISLPWTMTGYREIVSVEQSSGKPVKFVDWRVGRRYAAQSSVTSQGGVLFAWVEPTVDAQKFNVWPTLSSGVTLTLAAVSLVDTLSGSTAIPGPDRFVDAVVDQVCSVFYREDGNEAAAQTYAQMGTEKLSSLIQRYTQGQTAGAEQIPMDHPGEIWGGGY